MTNRLFYLLAFVLIIFAAGCVEDTDPIIENEEEVITAVTLTFFPADATQETVVYGFSDPDGDGGNAPVFSYTGTLAANSLYNSQVSFSNAMGTIDAEIVDEGTDHQVFITNTADLVFAYSDMDADGNPLGIRTTTNTGEINTGTMTLTLRHEPGKGAAVGITDLSVAGGETDVEVTFDVAVQ